ncbi:MAG TPA: YdjY domain-containing protein [Phycisphaerae bacterium]|nr:YdjY domain-containing protein [Phycisphaerae bacterium]
MSLWSAACAAPGGSERARDAGADRPSPTSSTASSPRVVDFVPGVQIDYRVPQVEVEAWVILRKGPLELFAYSKAPVPKEHESILLLHASPEAIYQALGLIGLVPGHPMRYFPESGTIRKPSGDPVDVLVQFESGGETKEISACDWMTDVARSKPMERTHWLFTGSDRLQDGTFYANVEGTVVTVVDFDSSVVALPDPHTSSNAALWLEANTDAIPPIGTKVTLILRPASR